MLAVPPPRRSPCRSLIATRRVSRALHALVRRANLIDRLTLGLPFCALVGCALGRRFVEQSIRGDVRPSNSTIFDLPRRQRERFRCCAEDCS